MNIDKISMQHVQTHTESNHMNIMTGHGRGEQQHDVSLTGNATISRFSIYIINISTVKLVSMNRSIICYYRNTHLYKQMRIKQKSCSYSVILGLVKMLIEFFGQIRRLDSHRN
jgi:hypothetical protein